MDIILCSVNIMEGHSQIGSHMFSIINISFKNVIKIISSYLKSFKKSDGKFKEKNVRTISPFIPSFYIVITIEDETEKEARNSF